MQNAEEAESILAGKHPFFSLSLDNTGTHSLLLLLLSIYPDAANEIPDIKRRLANAERKKNDLEGDLQDAQRQLNDIKRGSVRRLLRAAVLTSESAGTPTALLSFLPVR